MFVSIHTTGWRKLILHLLLHWCNEETWASVCDYMHLLVYLICWVDFSIEGQTWKNDSL